MAIQISGQDAVDDNRRGIFLKANPGTYTNSNRPSASTGDIIYNSDEEALQVWNGSEWSSMTAASPPGGTGGTVISVTGYKIHVFTSPGVFTAKDVPNADVLVVAGGGSGGGVGNRIGGGGGAGGFRLLSNFPIADGSYEVVIGQGGRSPAYNWGTAGASGSDSIFSTITATGGGGGAGGTPYPDPGSPGTPGGSGGGAQRSGSEGTGNDPPSSPPQGNPGGSGGSNSGGGGAGGPGNTSGGGIGAPVTWLPTSYGTPGPQPGRYFAGGGGTNGGDDGGTNTGGGGTAANSSGPTFSRIGGEGGPGIVAIRYSV